MTDSNMIKIHRQWKTPETNPLKKPNNNSIGDELRGSWFQLVEQRHTHVPSCKVSVLVFDLIFFYYGINLISIQLVCI